MGKMKKKGKSGKAALFESRTKAVKKLGINLKQFRKLCILKGIYPQDSKSKKGFKPTQTIYYKKDVAFIGSEPLIDQYRRARVVRRNIKKYEQRGDEHAVKRWRENMPVYKYDHIIKQRYPRFVDALQDLDDCLSMCFLFATLPKVSEQSVMARKLTIEFMQYVIETHSLDKVFISIKGYYYQVVVMGQRITWVVPHYFGYDKPQNVDFEIMKTFNDLYLTLLGFVNFHLFHTINAVYPPQITDAEQLNGAERYADDDQDLQSEAVSALNRPVRRKELTQDEATLDDIQMEEDGGEASSSSRATSGQAIKLFEGLKFFINREVPREPFVFVIRCFGGEASWDKNVYIGATFDQDDQTITHEIVDRPKPLTTCDTRLYVQPQWVFDCVNSRTLLPVKDYVPGVRLPPHLSPFVSHEEGDYIPPEKRAQMASASGSKVSSGVEVSSDEEEDEEEMARMQEEIMHESAAEDDEEESESESEEEEERAPPPKFNKNNKKTPKEKMKVIPVKEQVEDPGKKELIDMLEERKLAELMIPKRKQRLYNTLMKEKAQKAKKVDEMEHKRKTYEKERKKQEKKKAQD